MGALFTAEVQSIDGRRGKIESQTGSLTHDLSMPKAMGGDGGPGTNPEELFAAGYAACFHSAVRFAARKNRIELSGSSVFAAVSIHKGTDGAFDLSVKLRVELDGPDESLAKVIVDEAHERLCPYSRAIKQTVPVEIEIV